MDNYLPNVPMFSGSKYPSKKWSLLHCYFSQWIIDAIILMDFFNLPLSIKMDMSYLYCYYYHPVKTFSAYFMMEKMSAALSLDNSELVSFKEGS